MTIPWWGYVVLAGLAWGTYVPIIFYGGSEFGGKPNARLMAILCVGVAYFVLAVLFPMFLFLSGQEKWPTMATTGLVFSSLAGVAGAVGAICVVFASRAAVGEATAQGLPPATFRIFIAPLIFGIAPVINALLSTVWHPKPDNPFHFGFTPPTLKMMIGFAMVASGVFLVLLSKEEAEAGKGPSPTPTPVAITPTDSPS